MTGRTMTPAYRVLGPHDAPRTVWFLHGILGSGNNWHSFARRLLRQHPGWKAVLVDLRNHGDSHGALPPHSLQACAQDLWSLMAKLGGPPAMIVGHSFGGKVALCFADQASRLGSTGAGALEQVWVLDATPGAWPQDALEDTEVAAVLKALRDTPQPLARRQDVVTWLGKAGFSSALSQWMTTNLRRQDDGYWWRFDLDAAQEMIQDYFAEDLWSVLDDPDPAVHIDVVRAEQSERWTNEDLDHFDRLAGDGAVALHLLRDSGHWVHADNPKGLQQLLDASL